MGGTCVKRKGIPQRMGEKWDGMEGMTHGGRGKDSALGKQ